MKYLKTFESYEINEGIPGGIGAIAGAGLSAYTGGAFGGPNSDIRLKKNIEFAVSELSEIFSDLNSSSIHKTKAEGFEGEDFLNSVISGTCQFSFDALNKKLKEIENAAGRDRNAPKFSARTLDIDIVLQLDEDDEIIYESEEITQYKFVSEPLKEIL